ncbi:MAG: hypothetical protein KC482_18925, partial [Dehalococcoidia bacterium]|nr:hypothetical protein [Dehalococcoidia bacterium]
MTRNLPSSTVESPLPELGAPVPADAPTILVVEDEENLLFTLRYNLEREGYRVLTANRGDDGLRIAHERSP